MIIVNNQTNRETLISDENPEVFILFLIGAVTEPTERQEYLDSDEEEDDDGDAGDEGDADPGPGPDVVQPVCGVEPVSPGLETEKAAVSPPLQSAHRHPVMAGPAGECPGDRVVHLHVGDWADTSYYYASNLMP